MDKHFIKHKSTSFFAEQLQTSAQHLNLITKIITGRTASEVVRTRSILEAKRLLTVTNYPVSEVAGYLNYANSSYFAKVFKEETTQSPVAFKNTMVQKYQN